MTPAKLQTAREVLDVVGKIANSPESIAAFEKLTKCPGAIKAVLGFGLATANAQWIYAA